MLLLTLHHIIADGWSMGVLLRELAALYGAYLRGQPSPLPRAADPVRRLRRLAARAGCRASVLQTQLGVLAEQLAGRPPLLELPTDQPRPAVQSLSRRDACALQLGADADGGRCKRSAAGARAPPCS